MKKEIREKVFAKYNGHCAYCGKDIAYNEMQVDHLIPQRLLAVEYDFDEIECFENYMPSCRRCNHYKGDLFICLTYGKGERPGSLDEGHDIFRMCLKKIKRKDKDFKYMGVSEIGSRGGIHHHLLIDKDFDINIIIELWNGGVNIKKTFTGDLSQVASYMTKGECDNMFEEAPIQRAVEKKYIASRNLKKPIVKKEVIKKSSHWTSYPRSKKLNGVMYDLKKGSEYNGHTADGYEYQRYIMVRRN